MNIYAYKQDGVTMPILDATTNKLVYDILKENSTEACSGFSKTDATSNGIEYSWSGNTCTLDGSNPSNVSLNNIVYKANGTPGTLVPGESYYVDVTGLTDKLTFRMQYEDTSEVTQTTILNESGWITIPTDVGAYFLLRLYVATGADFYNHQVTVNIYPMRFSSAGSGAATPQMYGAVGDGVTDDTAAVQACINNNRNVYLPEGTYLITADLTIAMAGQKITGAGRTSVIKASGCNAFSFTSARYYATFEDFAVQGDGTTAYVGFRFYAITFNYTFRNLYVHDFKYGFQLNSDDSVNGKHNVNTLITQCEITNCDYGVQIINTQVSQVNALKIEKTYIHVCNIGINATGNIVEVESSIVERNNVGILIDAYTSALWGNGLFTGTQGFIIDKSYFERNVESCIRVDSSHSGPNGIDSLVKGLTITNNYIYVDDSCDTVHPVIDINSRSNPYIYDGYWAENFGCLYSGVTITGNALNFHRDMHDAKVLIEAHNLLGSDCVIDIGIAGSHNWNDTDKRCYIIQNTGRAVVNDIFGFKNKRIFLDGGTVKRFDVIPLSISVTCNSGSGTMTLYGYPKDTAVKTTIATASITSGSNVLNNTDFDKTVKLGNIDTFEIGFTGTMTLEDPIVKYVSRCI